MKRCNGNSAFAPVIAYASGTNHPCDIRGVAAARVPIGLDVSKISEAGISVLLESKVPLLLDSGAFSEVSVCCGRVVVTKPISDSEWRKRLEIYLRLSKALCKTSQEPSWPRVTVIAPDHVGSQELTLRRLKKFKNEIRAIKGAGAEVIVPLQGGDLDIAAFYQRAAEVLQFKAVPAIPMKKAACPPDEIIRFLERTRVGHIHLLGIGLANRKSESLIQQMQAVLPRLRISLDSNRIRAAVGENRPITVRERQYQAEFAESLSGEVDLREWGGLSYDMTELLFSPSKWLAEVTDVRDFANSLTWLSESQRHRFAHNPDAFLGEEDVDDWLAHRLFECYATFVRRKTRTAARSKAVATVFRQAAGRSLSYEDHPISDPN